MNHRPLPHRRALVLALACAACASAPSESPTSDAALRAAEANRELPQPEQPPPWTDAFAERALLLAREVQVEGPAGLLQHLHCDARAEGFSAETTSEGYRQVVELPLGSGGHIFARLDELEIRAEQRLVVLERVVPCDLVVTASGDVFWAEPATGRRERGERWQRVGVIER